MSVTHTVRRLTHTRIPTVDGTFALSLYENSRDDKDHLALVHGDVRGADDVLVRVHSECFTGDVLGSLRCDCGEQLNRSMQMIAEAGRGVLLYLRQEGRGIGLLSKLRAYDLQDEGYDTVEANLMLGHGADERDYTIGALMLEDLGVASVRLLTNNPEKIESLERHGVTVTERVPLTPHLNEHNTDYLQTKANRMRHMLDLGPMPRGRHANRAGAGSASLRERARAYFKRNGLPFVTLTYAQALDGSIAASTEEPLAISGAAALTMTHELRALHDAILVGIGTVLTDDPQLTVRRTEGPNPRPVILDTSLRTPLDAQLLQGDGPAPLIATDRSADPARAEALEDAGATVLRLDCDAQGVCLDALLDALADEGLQSLMVEGGREIITSFLSQQHVNHLVLTIAPRFVGGVPAVAPLDVSGDGYAAATQRLPALENIHYQWYGTDLVLHGDPTWEA
ncbi:GTP cyclohydrolase II [Salisaeta longa]|uniref:GTP cyclohydrolase II n=1 Tax=Salisaeta longa TaxID=503170 RepID=UPI0003B56F75|nr:GTP cyclohydrolase II [Salisaeta longa]